MSDHDPILFQVLRARLGGIVQEMQASLFRSGFSTVIRESQDASCALLAADCKVVAQHVVLPLHMGAFPACARAVVDSYGSDIHPGDVFILNHPYQGGSPHAPDMAAVVPLFDPQSSGLVAFAASMAHKSDIGGPVAGSCWSGATDVFGEGIQVPPVRYHREGTPSSEIERLLGANSRAPRQLLGDLRGQIGACHLGERRLAEVIGRYGIAALTWFFDEVGAVTKRGIRSEIAGWRDGRATASRLIDDDGISLGCPVRVQVEVVKSGADLQFDFSGSDPQTRGPANIRFPLLQAACAYVVVALLGGDTYINSGLLESFGLVAPPGMVVNAEFPAPVNTYNPTVHAVVDACFEACSKLIDGRGRADGCASRSFVLKSESASAVQYEIFGGGAGASDGRDGASGTTVNHTNGRIAPVEIVETEYPVRVLETSLIPDSGGPGEYRGGLGIRRSYQVLERSQFALRSTRHDVPPAGAAGGLAGRGGRIVVNPGRADERSLPARCAGVTLDAGDVFVLDSPGGGGYGAPTKRSPEKVAWDVTSGWCSPQSALSDFGVVLEVDDQGRYEVDVAETIARRTAMVPVPTKLPRGGGSNSG